MENQELTNQIKVQRAIKNITQEELAAQIGVTRKTINTIETGKFVPSTILAIKLARFFEMKVEELFTLNEK
jgi:putative transcriptional regulator